MVEREHGHAEQMHVQEIEEERGRPEQRERLQQRPLAPVVEREEEREQYERDAELQRRVGEALTELSKRVGFRVIPGLSERVIFRELFPSGLTLLDRGQLGELGVSHIAARQELREMIAGLGIPEPGVVEPVAAAG